MFYIYPFFFLVYIVLVERLNFKRISFKLLLVIFILVNTITLLLPSVSSDDLSSYIFWSRLFSRFGANPYYEVYSNFQTDPLYSSLATVWSDKTTVYGPLFMLLGSGLTFLAGDNLFLNFFFFKLTFAVLIILTGWLIYKVTRSKQALFLFAANPIIILELILDRHNDLVMIFFIVAALAIKDYIKSWTFLLFSVLIKFTSLILLPFYVFWAVRSLRLKKLTFVSKMTVIALLLLLAFHFPFWLSPDMYGQLNLVSQSQYPYPSSGIFILSFFLPFSEARSVSRIIFLVIYTIVFMRFIKLKKISRTQLVEYSLFTSSLFLGLYLTLVLPWYFTTLITLAAILYGLNKRAWLRIFIYLITAESILLHFMIV